MFRFTIRDLLWLMVVVGMAVGRLADHHSLHLLLINREDKLRLLIRDVEPPLITIEGKKAFGILSHVPRPPAKTSRFDTIALPTKVLSRHSTGT